MNRKQLVSRVSRITQMTTSQSGTVVSCMLDCIKAEVVAGEIVRLRGFGTFSLAKSKSKRARNIRTGELMIIPASKRVKFVTHQSFKKELK